VLYYSTSNQLFNSISLTNVIFWHQILCWNSDGAASSETYIRGRVWKIPGFHLPYMCR